ncbi:Mu transposase domain-containing protein [Nonomuraea basaltis]|uniref:Mu transposase domain-containing protein n=1 Tax=Nonomuraea basaltis TaxID=2495887 RepID=UPI00197D72E7|nr:helix-turn-helix domain-containing protein [Nonomuraea basaltis]
MLTQGEDVEAHALRKRGWSISAIARHLGRDRKTIAAYLNGSRAPGVRRSSRVDPFAEFEQYCRIRLAQDPHLLAMTLFDEITALGYAGGYSTFTRAIRKRGLRPHCEPCQQARGRDVGIIEHEPGGEVQWDWLHLPDPPTAWAWPHREAYLLASFAPVLKYYGIAPAICRPRRAQRKGSVEKANDSAAQRWWRTLAEEMTPEQAQTSLDSWCRTRGDVRVRWRDRIKTTVASVAAAEPLAALPERPYPALLEVERVVSPQGLVSFEGNHYSVPPGYRDQQVLVRWRLDEDTVEIISAAGNTLARHRLAVRGAHEIVRPDEHVRALEKAVLAATGDDRAPCRRKKRIPPSQEALAEAERIRAARQDGPAPAPASGSRRGSGQGLAGVTDFAAYAAAARALGPATGKGRARQDERAGRGEGTGRP